MINNVKKHSIILVTMLSICILFFIVYMLNIPNIVTQDIDLSINDWKNIYEIDTSGISKVDIINDANNDDIINIRILDKDQKIVHRPFSIQLGEEKELDSLNNGYMIQAQATEIDGNYRITILKNGK